jgi:hypothetical protein
MNIFMNKDIEIQGSTSQTSFELKHEAFLLKLLRIFIMAAFSTSSKDSEQQAAFTRRLSNANEENTSILASANLEVSRFVQL